MKGSCFLIPPVHQSMWKEIYRLSIKIIMKWIEMNLFYESILWKVVLLMIIFAIAHFVRPFIPNAVEEICLFRVCYLFLFEDLVQRPISIMIFVSMYILFILLIFYGWCHPCFNSSIYNQLINLKQNFKTNIQAYAIKRTKKNIFVYFMLFVFFYEINH